MSLVNKVQSLESAVIAYARSKGDTLTPLLNPGEPTDCAEEVSFSTGLVEALQANVEAVTQ